MESSRCDHRNEDAKEGKPVPENGGDGDRVGARWQGEEVVVSSQPEFGTVLGFSALMTELG